MLVCATTSFTLMPVPDALCIIFACPVVTILLSAAVLGDSLNPPKLAAALLLFSGVALVCRPPFIFGARAQPAPGSGYYLGAALAVTACVAQGVACVLVARCREVATPVLAAWSSVAGLVLGAASCLLDQSTPLVGTQPLQWATLLGRSWTQSGRVSHSSPCRRTVCVRAGGLHHADPRPAADLPQPGVQPPLPGDGGRLPGPVPHHGRHPQPPLLRRRPPRHPRLEMPQKLCESFLNISPL